MDVLNARDTLARDLVGGIAVTMTILQFLSGALVCKEYMIKRSTGESTSLQFIACVLSCDLWLLYGLNKGDHKIVLVNLVGVTLMVIYTVIFYSFTTKKYSVIREGLAACVVFFGVLVYAKNEDNREQLAKVLGLLASAFTLVTISAPMAKLFYIIKVKNTECLPFPMILMAFVVSSLWTLYGYIVEDPFIQVVNVIGVGLGAAQLSLFLVYPRTAPKYEAV